MSLNSSLEALGELMATNLREKGIIADASDGLTTLANKILNIESPSLILTFTGTTLTEVSSASAPLIGNNVIIDYGDGTIEESDGNFGHTYNSNGTYTIKIYDVTSLGNYCFGSCTGLTSITIPNSVTSIGDNCFYYCDGLTNITIPNSVTSLGNYCFRGCVGLTSIELNWTSSNNIITYNSNWITTTNHTLKFSIPNGTTSLYTAKGYPSDKLVERS